MRTLRFMIVLCVAAASASSTLSGCSGAMDQPWSTKDQSVLGAAALDTKLHVAAMGSVGALEVAPENLRPVALDLLSQGAEAKNPQLRANAIEALHYAPEHLEPLLRAALLDENRGVRFVAVMTAGKFRIDALASRVASLLSDHSPSVRAAAIYALRRCERPADPSPLVPMLFGDDPEAKANAAMVLGELGNPSALPMLRRAVTMQGNQIAAARAKIVDLQLAEAMVRLGDNREFEVIRAALFAPPEQAELTALACQICGRLGIEAVLADLSNLIHRSGEDERPGELRLIAAHAVAQIDPSRAPYEVAAAYLDDERYEMRAQAALTLGQIGDPISLPTLQAMLEDPNPLVQIAAAGAIVQITEE